MLGAKGEFTIRVAGLLKMLPVEDVAIIIDVPAATDVANPLEPAALLMVATEGVEEVHVTALVRFCIVLSEYVPVAVNCCVAPAMMMGLAGVTAMEINVVAVTVSVVALERLPNVAVIIVVPAATPVARPALDMVALLVFDELHVTDPVRFCVE